MTDWRPIESAPKDRSLILLAKDKFRFIGKFINEDYIEQEGLQDQYGDEFPPGWYEYISYHPRYDNFYYERRPTHWKPLDPPPGDPNPTTQAIQHCIKLTEQALDYTAIPSSVLLEIQRILKGVISEN